MKKILVCGAGGFIGGHLVNRLKADGYWVRGVDLKHPDFSESEADEYSDKYENMHEYGETKVVECTLVDNGLE